MSAIRTDIHRPSAINPEEYELIAIFTVREAEGGDIGAAFELAREREAFISHMNSTGAKFSTHYQSDGAGQCQVCGAHCVDYAVFYHEPTNAYIKTGFDCADKMEIGDARRFRNFRKARKTAEELATGKKKAKATLEEAGLGQVWTWYAESADPQHGRCGTMHTEWIAESMELDDYGYEEVQNILYTLTDLVYQLVKRGQLSDKQWKLMHALYNKIYTAEERARKRQQEIEQAESVPSGRQSITGTVVSVKYKMTDFGEQLKVLIKDDRGFKVFGTAPKSFKIAFDFDALDEQDQLSKFDIDRGDRVTLTGTLKQSNDDRTFGFFSRPSKAQVLEANSQQADDKLAEIREDKRRTTHYTNPALHK